MVKSRSIALEDQLETLRLAFDAAYDGLHIVDKDGNTLMINKACERIEGISAGAVAHKNIRQLVNEGYFSDSVTLKVLELKKPVTIMQKVKNGKEVLVTGMPIYSNGKIEKVIINSRDITELNVLKRNLSESELLAEKYHDEWKKLNSILFEKEIVCNSEAMNRLLRMLLNIAKVDSTVLITGESGTGKGLLSKFIHNNSLNKDGAFIKIDCGAIPESLFESEIFGFEKGTFTGGDTKGRIGLVELSNRGTLFLDEIGEVPFPMQVKLLRLLQEKIIYRVGGKEPIPVNARIVAATNRDLKKMVGQGVFREDLYYRLNVIPVCIPPLRERKADIHMLIVNILDRLNKKYKKSQQLSTAVMDKLIDYQWPGNVRELENVIERLVVLSDKNIIGVEDLPNGISSGKPTLNIKNMNALKSMVESFEKGILEELLQRGLKASEIAVQLEVDITTVRRKIHKYGLSMERKGHKCI